jgi:hypothetical protein
MNTPLFDSHKREECEAHLLTTIKAEVQKLWDRTVVYFDQSRQYLETRRHPDTHEEMDYELRLRELEGTVGQERGFRMRDYNENGGRRVWEWVLGIVGTLIAMGIGAVAYQLSDLKADMRASLARQEMDEKRIDRLENHTYRGGSQ